ncbi:MAG: hypothetical protein HQK49_11555 [Oligoflexia bacterium]|nr:hypothetical protein [Oligoflexia bacterium]
MKLLSSTTTITKFLFFLTFLSSLLFSKVSIAIIVERDLANNQFKILCSKNILTSKSAEKTLWRSYQCGYITKREFDFYLNEDDGKKRKYALYPLFTNTQHNLFFLPDLNCQELTPLYDKIIICPSVDDLYFYCQKYKEGELSEQKKHIFTELLNYLEQNINVNSLDCFFITNINSQQLANYNPLLRDLDLSGHRHRMLLQKLYQ